MAEPAPQDTPQDEGPFDKRVRQFVAIREKRRALKKAYTDQDSPLAEGENLLSAAILKLLTDAGIENARTKHGTAFKTTKSTASLGDPAAFMDYVIANGKFDLIDRKANTTAVRAFVEEHHELPPGVNLNTIATIGVHKKVGGGPDTD